jgi:hypothetical protein
MAPRCWIGERSPQSTVTSRIGLGFAVAAVTVNVNDAGNPALAVVVPVANAISSVGAPATPTVTLPDA